MQLKARTQVLTDSRVVESSGHEQGRIVLRLHIVIRRVAQHVVEVFLLVGVAPLSETHYFSAKTRTRRSSYTSSHSVTVSGMDGSDMVFITSTKGTSAITALNSDGNIFTTGEAGGETDRQTGVDYLLTDAHQKAACTGPLRGEATPVGDLLHVDQVKGAISEVQKGVHLLQVLALLLVPVELSPSVQRKGNLKAASTICPAPGDRPRRPEYALWQPLSLCPTKGRA